MECIKSQIVGIGRCNAWSGWHQDCGSSDPQDESSTIRISQNFQKFDTCGIPTEERQSQRNGQNLNDWIEGADRFANI